MRRWMGTVAVGLVVGLNSPSFGQMGGMGLRSADGRFRNFGDAGAYAGKDAQVCQVVMETTDGKTTTGHLRLTTAVIDCSLGVYEIKPTKVQEIRFEPPTNASPGVFDSSGIQRSGSIITTSGDKIAGVVLIPSWWRVETDLGSLAPNSLKIRSIAFRETHPKPSLIRAGSGPAPIESTPGDPGELLEPIPAPAPGSRPVPTVPPVESVPAPRTTARRAP